MAPHDFMRKAYPLLNYFIKLTKKFPTMYRKIGKLSKQGLPSSQQQFYCITFKQIVDQAYLGLAPGYKMF